MEKSKKILEEALKLKPQERFLLIEGLIQSLDEPNKTIDEIWINESEKRLKAHREGRLQGIPYENVFGEKQSL